MKKTMKNTIKKLISIATLTSTVMTALAGNVNIGWDTYIQGSTNVIADIIKVYAVPGTNTVFANGNSNATFVSSTSITNTTFTLTNLPAGAWTITITAYSTPSVLESINATPVWAVVPLKGMINLRFLSVSP